MEAQRIKLLIADDDTRFCKQIKRAAMMTEDIDVIAQASNGEQALEQIETLLPDVVLLKAVLPRLDGIGVIERIRRMALEKAPHVLFLTLKGQEIMEALAIERGVDMCIHKGMETERLFLYIRTCMRRSGASMAANSVERYERIVCEILDSTHMSRRLDGYRYLLVGVALVCVDGMLIRAITTRLYPMIAKQCQTEPKRVERSIRHAIETTINTEGYQAMYEVFGNTIDPQRGKPTNGEFIALLAEIARMQMRRGL